MALCVDGAICVDYISGGDSCEKEKEKLKALISRRSSDAKADMSRIG